MAARQCEATTKDGRPCGVPALAGSSLCFTHSPAAAAERAEAQRRGGHGRANKERLLRSLPSDLLDVWDRLIGTLDRLERGALEPRQATALAAVVGRLIDLTRLVHELGTAVELEERLRRLEESLEALTHA